MHKLVIGLAVLAMAAITLPVLAAPAAMVDEPSQVTPGNPAHIRTNDCPGNIVWDTGMFDEFTPPSGCSTAGSAGCFVNAINEGGFPVDGRRLADDWVADGQPITHVKIWARFNAQGYDYHLASNGLHGFCVKFYLPVDPLNPWCPDGSVDGEEAIGTIVYDQYVDAAHFVEYEITTGLARNFNFCLTLPTAFNPVAGNAYWVSVSADFDFTSFGGGVTQWFWRLCPGFSYSPFCESMWWDVWNTPSTPWIGTSIALALPCWAGWDQSFVLYSAAQAQGACCLPDGTCRITAPTECQGEYMGDGTVCDPNPCAPPQGACCFADGTCAVLTSGDCETQGGQFQGDGTVCVPNPCPPVPVIESTWGKIKNQYH